MQFLIQVDVTRHEQFLVTADTYEDAEQNVRDAFNNGPFPNLSQASDLEVGWLGTFPEGKEPAVPYRFRDFDTACEEDDSENVCAVHSESGIMRARVAGQGEIEITLERPRAGERALGTVVVDKHERVGLIAKHGYIVLPTPVGNLVADCSYADQKAGYHALRIDLDHLNGSSGTIAVIEAVCNNSEKEIYPTGVHALVWDGSNEDPLIDIDYDPRADSATAFEADHVIVADFARA